MEFGDALSRGAYKIPFGGMFPDVDVDCESKWYQYIWISWDLRIDINNRIRHCGAQKNSKRIWYDAD